MSQYGFGRVRLRNGSALVDAEWEMYVGGGLSARFEPGGPVRYSPSGASAAVVSHDTASTLLVVALDGGSPDVDPGDGINGASDVLLVSGATATGGGASTLTDTAQSWTPSAFVGDWLRIRPGAGTEEYRQITANTPTQITVAPAFGTPPTGGTAYQIHEDAGAAAGALAFPRGTPQDWTAASVASGMPLFVDGEETYYEIATPVVARQLTLSTPWAGSDVDGKPYAIHRSFTPNRSYPWPGPGDKRIPALLRRLVNLLDIDIAALFSGSASVEAFQSLARGSNWDLVAAYGQPQLYQHAGRVYLQGTVKASSPVTGGVDSGDATRLIGTLPVGYRPGARLIFGAMLERVDVKTNGEVTFEGVDGFNGWLPLHLSFRLGGV